MAHLCLDGFGTTRGIGIAKDESVGCVLLCGSWVRAYRVDFEDGFTGHVGWGEDITEEDVIVMGWV